MADIDWLRRHDEATGSVVALRTLINDTTTDRSVEVRRKFLTLDQQLADLQRTLPQVGTAGEQARRKGKLSKLQQERALLQQTFQARTGAVIEKFRGARQSPTTTTGEEGLQTLGLSNEQLLQLQREAMTHQDRDLDDLHSAAVRIKNVGRMIGNELAEQGRLLDDFGDEEDQAIRRMEKERGRIAALMAQNKLGVSFCVVLLLVIVLTILILLLLGVI
eukprot:EG_transcript_23261